MHNFRTQYDYRKVHQSFKGVVGLTDQQYKDDCSIEGIIKRYGILPSPEVAPVFSDVSDIGDFGDCLQRIEEGLTNFQNMPSAIRDRFGNDPKSFYAFLANPENVDEAIKLGLLEVRKNEPSVVDVLKDISNKVTPKEEAAAK